MTSLDFERDGVDWPNREFSRFVTRDEVHWHVQVAGEGPVALLLHGTGASTHSFRDLIPELSASFTVVVPDLPGHAFTRAPRAMVRSLSEMSRALRLLLETLELSVDVVLGHSAGAAIAARMVLDGEMSPNGILSVNGAFLPFDGIARTAMPLMAKVIDGLGFVPSLVASRVRSSTMVESMLENTGSEIDARGQQLYQRLASSPAHVSGILAMTAGWDLERLSRELPGLPCALWLAAAERDRLVPVERTERTHRLVPGSRLIHMDQLGHLAHEESPKRFSELLRDLHATASGPR
ncbi:MAG: alpha/beta fold hydrolase BchO [Myxococcota bacterium]